MKKGLSLVLISLLLSGCSSLEVPKTFQYQEIDTTFFRLASWQKITDPNKPVRIYIEGDGYAFNAHGRASSNPTPKEKDFRKLAFGDPHDNVVYLARPCQFISGIRCHRMYWSTGRFSNEVIVAMGEALEMISNKQKVTLIGYSGGAQVAGLCAVTNKNINVQKIITIAGNLDHQAWCRHHNVPLLSDSMDLTKYWLKFSEINQIHFLCENDDVIPPKLTLTRLGNDLRAILLSDATHANGWLRYADLIYKQ